MARRRRKSRKSRSRGRRRSKAFYAAIGRKGARARARKRAARRAAAKKSSRRRGRPKYRRGRRYRPTLRRYKGRFYASPGSRVKGRRINPRRGRRRRNPGLSLRGLFPTSISDFKDFAVMGAAGAGGWLGVSMMNGFMDRLGVANLKAKITSTPVLSLVNALQSAVSTFVLAGLTRVVIKRPDIVKGVFVGGAAKTVHSLAVPFLAKAAANGGVAAPVAEAALSGFQEQLSGYQYAGGVSGFQVEPGSGMGWTSPVLDRIGRMNYEENTIFG